MAKDSLKKHSVEDNTSIDETVPVVTPEQDSSAEPTVQSTSIPLKQEQGGGRAEIAKSASLVAMGSLFSSIMGVGRQIAVASTGVAGSFFLAALKPTQTFYDLLVNGSVSGALIPTFNDYADQDKTNELRRLVYTLVNLIILVTLVASIVFFFIAPWFVYTILVPGFTEEGKRQTLQLAQIIFFGLIAMGPFSVMQGALYARKAFGWPTIAISAYHIGIIIGAVFTAWWGQKTFGSLGLAFGVLLGAVGEIIFLLPAIIKQRLHYMFVLDLKHPALKSILKLYAPVAFSFLVSMVIVFIDANLQSQTPCVTSIMNYKDTRICSQANLGALGFATTLVQFPIGQVAMALQMAVLPLLATHAREANHDKFKETLLLGFRLGLLLMIPAMAGLIVLQTPITKMLFERGNFSSANTALTALALQYYSLQLPFVALDQLLIAAFYSRKDTVTPVVLNFACIGAYLLVALSFYQSWGMPSIAFANTVQNSLHGLILLLLLRRKIGSLHLVKMLPALLKIVVGTAVLVGIAVGLQFVFKYVPLFSMNVFSGRLLTVVVAGGLAAAGYFVTVMVLKVEEVHLLKQAVMKKLGRS